MKSQALTDEQVVAAIQQEESAAYGLLATELSEQREQAMDRYLGRPYGDEIPGRSQIVSSDVADAVEWIMPDLLEMFVSGDDIVVFDAKGPEDEAQAQQESDYINSIIMDRNPAFIILNSWFKDALIQKNGYVKAFQHTSSDVMVESYEGLSQEEMDYILKDAEVEVIGQVQYPDPTAPMVDPMLMQQAQMMGQPLPPPPLLTDVRVKRKAERKWVKIEPVPPEEVLVSVKTNTVSLQDSPFVQHRVRRTLSELRQMGYEIPDDIGDDTQDTDSSVEAMARDRFGENRNDTNSGDPSSREVTYRESYIRIDQDGDGVAELRRVCLVGHTVLHNELTEIIPIAAITPIIMAHRHIGLSYFDLIQDLARIKTALTRGLLDNLYLQNNGRTAADKNTVNLEDLLVSRPGGVVRTDGAPAGAMMPLVTPDMSAAALNGLTYIDDVKESRIGVSKYSQGLDPNTLVKTATQSSQLLTASSKRIKMIARCFAETGIKELFYLVHFLTLKHSSKAEKIKLRNKWVTVNPREWVNRFDLSINVGLGTGNKDQQMAHLQQILMMQKDGLQFGLTDMARIRTTLGKITQNAGFKNDEVFWSEVNPNAPPPQPPPPPEVLAAQVTAQAQKELTQMHEQSQQQIIGMQSKIKHGSDMQIAAAQQQHEIELETMRMQMQNFAKEAENRTRLLIAEMQEETKRLIAANKPAQPLNAGVPAPGIQ